MTPRPSGAVLSLLLRVCASQPNTCAVWLFLGRPDGLLPIGQPGVCTITTPILPACSQLVTVLTGNLHPSPDVVVGLGDVVD